PAPAGRQAPGARAPGAQASAGEAPAGQAHAGQAPDAQASNEQAAQQQAAPPQQPAPSQQPTPSQQQAPAAAPKQQAQPAAAQPAPAQPAARRQDSSSSAQPAAAEPETLLLRGPAARVVTNMEASLEVPTATSVRAVPAKLLIDNRTVINNHLTRGRGGKVSFTHLIGYAVVRALESMPAMNDGFGEVDGKPAILRQPHVNLGLAIDLAKPDGTRQLLVPSIKKADTMDFAQFWAAYEDVVRRARGGKLTADDFAGTTITLTNPGTIGTNHSVPRLMRGQGTIVGVGAMDYPAEYQGASPETLARMAVSKILTLTSTYDHRIIQGAQSGDFLRRVHELLLGGDDFYDGVFRALRIPYEPIRWARDVAASHEDDVTKQARVQELIHAYRVRGHLMADTDPLEFRQRSHPDLDIVNHGLTLWDLDREFATGGFGGKPMAPLREILGVLRDSYCRRVGIEYMHIQDPEERAWIQERVEQPHQKASRETQLRILRRLNAAEAFETFLQTKFVGQKRFSLEGSESVIPLLDAVLSSAADQDLDEVCIGMPHRGRLNVLANIAGKSYGQIFREFEGNQDPRSVQGSGDVKYHLGTRGTFTAESGADCKVYLAANPSHLEAVNPVLEGIARAKQDRLNKGGGGEGYTVLPVLLHGDAAFAGQGVVAETLNLSQLRGYRTGGTIHVIINNQVGFTTSPASSRSSFYSTDVARMIQAPIFHVNGDDPEACVRVARLAFEYRQTFKKDVVVDLVCYRRRGHNEGDDPSMTQPLMYSLIESKRSVRKLYTESLIGRGDISVEEAEQVLRDYQQQLERVFVETREATKQPTREQDDVAVEHTGPSGDSEVTTAVPREVVKRIGDAHVSIPEGFTVHPKLASLLERRAAMASEGGIDWAFGEILAFGSLLLEGGNVRLAGQDSRRGTFVQRHSVLIDKRTGAEWTPLAHLGENQGRFWVYDSLLSEFAAMGFEYGYSVERPDVLVLWEAQFGDFANGAQSIIDEFISSSEQKWGQRSSVVLLLPHGYEGQGPDHSSARIERYLALCAERNMTVAMPSTPANYFHLLRWQGHNEARRPLIVATPKSMLRLKAASSRVEDFTTGGFQPVIPDSQIGDSSSVDRVLLCTGKFYYDLLAERTKRKDASTPIIRMEALYPIAGDSLRSALEPYPDAELVWVQEEPANQGAWPFMALNLPAELGGRSLRAVSRPASASPAAGSHKVHEAEQRALVAEAFDR
ncbi:MAG: multifunctional oxoglutarate decarboxylase/oxoglutarate dehydrogenase thiamine pyrophosphate-binding subunit/dihydrolipoyllysine-residue succinyltransferase subunit, partial [Actinomycetota bacterium]|nr:multifunctional oxoglutarate decarboxylase/oxoglutarate dehydrogenase thiamine pyrophosphate-binding subunit/dihydrolipoyllysine-residue succinyltransferase subunit [Actinomycetota bacterium]